MLYKKVNLEMYMHEDISNQIYNNSQNKIIPIANNIAKIKDKIMQKVKCI